MKKALKIVLAIIAILIIIAIVFAIFRPKPLPAMTTAVAEVGTVAQTIDLSGNLVYPQIRQVAFPQSGQVNGVYVALGQIVFAGDILADLGSTTVALENGETALIAGVSITAPQDGIVTSVLITPDDFVAAGQPVIVISGPTRIFQVAATVPESAVVALSAREYDATVTVDALPGVIFNGRVISIAPSTIPIQGVVSYEARIILTTIITDGKGGFDDLRAGMSASVSVITKTISDAIHIPQRAILVHDDGSKFVRVISSNKEFGYDERSITTGLRGDNGTVVITDGLAAGETVVVSIKK